MKLYCIVSAYLCTQKPGLKKVDLEPSHKTDSQEQAKTEKRTQEKEIVPYKQDAQTGLALRQVGLKCNAKKGIHGTEALVNIYWLF